MLKVLTFLSIRFASSCKVEKLSYKMEHMFCGLSDETRGKLCLLRMIAESVALLLVVKKGREIEQ